MLRIGHREAKAYKPENTLHSFKKALELEVDAVELDFRRTKDDNSIIIHNPEVDRTTNGKGLVNVFTLEETEQIVAEKGDRIPILEETLDFLDRKVKILKELKESAFENEGLSMINEKGLERNVIIVSFLEETLKAARELNTEVETGLIYVKYNNPVKVAIELTAYYLLPLCRFTHTKYV